MKRLPTQYYFSLLFLVLLIGCSEVSPELTWITPGEGDNVVGTVQMRVEAVGETPPANVVFAADNIPIAKVYAADGGYNAIWNSENAKPGLVTLTAKPYGGIPIRREITLTNARNE